MCTSISLSLSLSLSLSGGPTFQAFIDFPTQTGRVNLAEKVGVEYFNFGILLLNDDDGSQTTAIERACLGRAEDINKELFRRWLGGRGRKPVAWSTLIEVLQSMRLMTLANKIKKGLELL